VTVAVPRASRLWSLYFRFQYRLIRLIDPLIRLVWRGFGLGNVVELRLTGRRTGKPRPVLVGLLHVGSDRYVGHPNGDAPWTRNLEATEQVQLCVVWPRLEIVTATRLPPGAEREAAIRATWQHVPPGNLVYRLARSHIRAVGSYFRLEPVGR
jgi:hypothetical protein